MVIKSIYALCAISALAAAAPAAAQVVSTRADFIAQTTGLTTIDFNGATGGNSNGMGASTTMSGVTFADTVIFNNGATVGSFAAGAAYGNGYLQWQGSNPGLLTITLPGAVTALGFDFMELRGRASTFTFKANGQTYNVSPGSTPGFFGFVSDTAISSFAISMPVSNGASQPIFPTIDNFSFGTASVAAVPEPASWALMLCGFGLTGAVMRRRVRKVSYAAA